LLLVSISLVSAWILYRFIENPMRSKIIKKMVPKV
jgi:peptidoglycan/LPS O-acetylase OafA/YrhL